MLRRILSLAIMLCAIGFACSAMIVIRWPRLIMLSAFLPGDDTPDSLSAIDWRASGLVYGVPFLLAAVCLYVAALNLWRVRRSSLSWYLAGLTAAGLSVLLPAFGYGQWRVPNVDQMVMAGGGAIALLPALVIGYLTKRPEHVPVSGERTCPPSVPDKPACVAAQPALAQHGVRPKTRGRSVPVAIACQRAAFAAAGRRILAKKRDRQKH